MSDITVEVQGLEALQRKLMPAHLIGPPVRTALQKSAFAVQRAAQQRAPVRTGRLRGSIVTEVDSATVPLFARVGTNVEYAAYQEFGTSRGIVGRFYLTGGFEASLPAINGYLADAAREIEARFQG